jgi:hypothetical protein
MNASDRLSRRLRVALRAAATGAGLLACPSFATGDVTSTPPPVVWEVEARVWQQGWNGLNDPTHVWVDGHFIKSIDNGMGGHAATSTSESWGHLWTWNGLFPSVGVSSGHLGPSRVHCGRYLSSEWSSNFIIEAAHASFVVSAWVRGAPGTEYVSIVEHSGLWAGTVQDSGKVSLSGFGLSAVSCQNCAVALPFAASSVGTVHVANGPTVTFDEYPGVVYTRVDFVAPDAAYVLTKDVSVLSHVGSESCILFCGVPSEVKGSGSMVSSARVFLPVGDPPQITGFAGGEIEGFVGQPLGVAASAIDPDNGGASGILEYEWRIDGTTVQAGETSALLSWAPPEPGVYQGELEVFDDEGMWATQPFTVVVTLAGDLDGDGIVGGADLGVLLGSWGACPPKGPCPADLTSDGIVDGSDLAVLLGAWGP